MLARTLCITTVLLITGCETLSKFEHSHISNTYAREIELLKDTKVPPEPYLSVANQGYLKERFDGTEVIAFGYVFEKKIHCENEEGEIEVQKIVSVEWAYHPGIAEEETWVPYDAGVWDKPGMQIHNIQLGNGA